MIATLEPIKGGIALKPKSSISFFNLHFSIKIRRICYLAFLFIVALLPWAVAYRFTQPTLR
jgi:hypothetical protein